MVLSAFMASKLQKVFKSSNFKGWKMKYSAKVIAVSRNILGLRPSVKCKTGNMKVRDYCLVWGCPGLVILTISLFVSLKVDNDFGQDNFAKFVTFVISSGLLGTVYYLFQSVLAEVSLRLLQVSAWYWQHRDRRARQGWLSLPFWVVCMFKNQRNSKIYSRFRWFLSKECRVLK